MVSSSARYSGPVSVSASGVRANGYGVRGGGGGSAVAGGGLNGDGLLLSPDSLELAELASASTQSTLPPDSGIASSTAARYTSLRQASAAARVPSALANRAIPPRPFPQSADEAAASQATRLLPLPMPPAPNPMNPLSDPNSSLADFGAPQLLLLYIHSLHDVHNTLYTVLVYFYSYSVIQYILVYTVLLLYEYVFQILFWLFHLKCSFDHSH